MSWSIGPARPTARSIRSTGSRPTRLSRTSAPQHGPGSSKCSPSRRPSSGTDPSDARRTLDSRTAPERFWVRSVRSRVTTSPPAGTRPGSRRTSGSRGVSGSFRRAAALRSSSSRDSSFPASRYFPTRRPTAERWGRRERIDRSGEVGEVARADARDVDLQDLGDVVRMRLLEEGEQRSDPFRDGLEEDERLGRRDDFPLPPVPRLGLEQGPARRQAALHGPVHGAQRRVPGRVRRENETDRSDGVGDVHRVRTHAPFSATVGSPFEKSSVAVARLARSTIAARAGTGVMFRIFWYSVSPCQVEAFRSKTPRYRSTP